MAATKPKRSNGRVKPQKRATVAGRGVNGHSVASIGDLVPDPANCRRHNPRNIGSIVNSLQSVGAARSIVIDEDNVILAGNGLVEAAGEAGITKLKVIEADGNTVIAVRRTGLTAKQKAELSIHDNRTAELAEWDAAQLLRTIAEHEIDLAGIEFREDEIGSLKASYIVPEFQPTNQEDQGRLDQKSPIKCPSCGHEFTT
jgi:ParB family transcriptional regulator, chromosome partitioning protein